MVTVDAAQRGRDRIAQLVTRGLDVLSLFGQASEVLRTTVPASTPPCWSTLDPASLLMTSALSAHGTPIPREVLAWEYLEDDALKTVDVARSPSGVQTLADATCDRPSSSRIYREYLQPMGMEHVVEVALRTRSGQSWGSVCLMRERGLPRFARDELDFLRSIAPLLADGVRRGVLVGEVLDPELPDAPGLVVLDERLELVSLTPGVERWLAELPGPFQQADALPVCVLAVAARAMRTAEGDAVPGEVAVARVLSRSGRWILLHGASLVADGGLRGAVIVEPAHPGRLAPLLMAAYGLTHREQEITRLVLRGDSTAEIAAALRVTAHTVQQHLKSIFDKAGVRSRRELVGKVFFAHYEPRLRDNERRTAAGHPIRGAPATASILAQELSGS